MTNNIYTNPAELIENLSDQNFALEAEVQRLRRFKQSKQTIIWYNDEGEAISAMPIPNDQDAKCVAELHTSFDGDYKIVRTI